MLVRRCAVVYFHAHEETEFDLDALISGGNGLTRRPQVLALAPHLESMVVIDPSAQAWLATLSPTAWVEVNDYLDGKWIGDLLSAGLIFCKGAPVTPECARDEKLRSTYWDPIASVMHAFSRWDGVDAVQNMKEAEIETAVQMRETLGAAPPEVVSRASLGGVIDLPRHVDNDFDSLLLRRVTCRNFDADRPVSLAQFSSVLHRSFGVTGKYEVGDDLVFLKKNVPSGGGLHPTEAYLIVQNVEGVAPGIYHYCSDSHQIELVSSSTGVDRDFVMAAVGQQHWFADAHVLVVLASRFERTFWKYRRHAKSYRVVTLEAGHISQTLYLAATDAGLGAFITAAINEKAIERALRLDPLSEGVIAVCGFGWRDHAMVTAELDPGAVVWDTEQSQGA